MDRVLSLSTLLYVLVMRERLNWWLPVCLLLIPSVSGVTTRR